MGVGVGVGVRVHAYVRGGGYSEVCAHLRDQDWPFSGHRHPTVGLPGAASCSKEQKMGKYGCGEDRGRFLPS